MWWCAWPGTGAGWGPVCTSTPPSCRCRSPPQSLFCSRPGLLLSSSSTPPSCRCCINIKVHCSCDRARRHRTPSRNTPHSARTHRIKRTSETVFEKVVVIEHRTESPKASEASQFGAVPCSPILEEIPKEVIIIVVKGVGWEKISKDIVGLVEVVARIWSFRPLKTIGIVCLPFLTISQILVGFGYLPEFLNCLLTIVWILIGVPLDC